MAEISIGEAVGSGFQLLGRRPGAAMVWGGVIVLTLVLKFAVMWPLLGVTFEQLAQVGKGGTPKPSDMTGMMGLQAVNYLTGFVQMMVMTVVYCAAFRAVIHPDQRGFASLRLGMTEVMLFVLTIGIFIAFFVCSLIVILPLAIVIGVLGAMHLAAVAVLFGVAAGIVVVWGMIYGALRLSMVGPMMVEDGKIHLVDAWGLTKGKTASLFAIALILTVLTLVGEIVVFGVLGGIGFGVLSAMAGGVQALPAFFKQPVPTILAHLTPLAAVFAFLLVPIYAVVTAIWGAPWARAYLDLRHSPADVF